jgi:hypothetical protein
MNKVDVFIRDAVIYLLAVEAERFGENSFEGKLDIAKQLKFLRERIVQASVEGDGQYE